MRCIIAGSRTITDYATVIEAIIKSGFGITEIVSGTARGVDSLGEQYALENNIPIKKFPANWDKYGKSAGYRRNAEMAEYADSAIILWDGVSKGTQHMFRLMENKPTYITTIKD